VWKLLELSEIINKNLASDSIKCFMFVSAYNSSRSSTFPQGMRGHIIVSKEITSLSRKRGETYYGFQQRNWDGELGKRTG